jgi:dTDP-glucose 4,6-dehydratase
LDTNFAIGNFIRDAMGGNAIKIAGDGTPLRSYLYAADMAAWLWTILLKGESGHAYNVGSDQAISISRLAQQVADVVAPGIAVHVAQKADPAAPAARYLPDITKAREKLGLKVRLQLADSISRTVQWHRNQKS